MGTRVLLVLFLSIVSLVTGEAGCRILEFLSCEIDKALKGHVIKTISMLAPGLEDCQHQCFMEDRCVSYNLGPVFGVIRSCELNDVDHVEHPDDVRSVPGAKYCAIKNPCSLQGSSCPKNLTCKPDFDFNTIRCIDSRSCASFVKHGYHKSGVYSITPVPGYTIQVYCDQVTDGGGWTVIQKRLDGSVNFYRGWDDYKRGFGDKNGEYWLGLDAIHNLTKGAKNQLRIDLKDSSLASAYALYGSFKISSEFGKYRLHVGKYIKGNAGDSLSHHNGSKFSTFDRDNDLHTDTNCAMFYKGGWWFNACYWSHLNGQYFVGKNASPGEGIDWVTWKDYYNPANKAEMKMRPVDFRHSNT